MHTSSGMNAARDFHHKPGKAVERMPCGVGAVARVHGLLRVAQDDRIIRSEFIRESQPMS